MRAQFLSRIVEWDLTYEETGHRLRNAINLQDICSSAQVVGEDLIDIKVEVIHGAQEAIAIWADQQDGSMRRNPPERCPRPLNPQDCPEENHNIPEDHQEEDPTKNKVKDETEEEAMTRGDQPCVSDGKDEILGDVST
ncbi:unnamed protein product, partial [Ranitomeya imitator]